MFNIRTFDEHNVILTPLQNDQHTASVLAENLMRVKFKM
jgi:hypothetical protein